MRRVAETPAPAPTLTRVGAVTPMSWPGIAPYTAFAGICYLAAPYLGLSSFDVDPRIAELWPTGGVGFVLLSTVWFLGHRTVLTTLGFMVLVYVVTAVALGRDPGPSLLLAVVGVAQPWLMAWIYRRRLHH